MYGLLKKSGGSALNAGIPHSGMAIYPREKIGIAAK
jgi:hypothetical protein